MTASMTAFARRETHQPWGSLSWEIRSVNQRYLEPSFRLPDSLRELEPALRQQLRQSLSRGKLDLTLRFYPAQQDKSLQLDTELLDQVIEAADQIYARMPSAAPLDPLKLLQWPGVLQSQEADHETVKQVALQVFNEALDELQQHRLREGEALAKAITERLQQMVKHLKTAKTLLPEALQKWRENLLERAAKLQVDVDPARLEQEVVLLAQKQDIEEELDRLAVHIREVTRALKSKEPIGRRLDFLMQEMNREANTLGSKAISMDMTQVSVDLKVLIEQMREQVQNIE
ncbi:YicC/YloC family endoribonuclease [Marinospirillum alkaliphilum]|uniref:TIGR00255 family protein n=1 Tax=Marinospirillum alkaliphilum DSM 21637 TaxID=1122209 RepID=A0A1K1WM65_9GAMM|nr:YicC/YloC family endoribonuclease [Marinospirillum alkaliphilum]SFX38430.1 TIGR00255 family protein [Marinospirillum alkaliphilum DSM 21637]